MTASLPHQHSSAQTIRRSALPGLAPTATRVVVDAAQPPWRGVVRVQTEIGLRCSGALIGPRLVLTAAHCLFGRATGSLVRPGSIHVLVGYSGGAYAGHARITQFEIGPGFALGPDQRKLRSSASDADWAVLTLDQALGTPDRVLRLARAEASPGTPVMLGGYEQDRAEVIVADEACTIVGPVRDDTGHVLLHHSCSATRGASGAPLLVRTPADGWAVIGIASTAAPEGGGYAVRIGSVDPGALTRSLPNRDGAIGRPAPPR